jgi:molecular chaperone DnaJ
MIDFPTAVFGGKVEVPTIDGMVRVTIDPGTQPGKVLRLKGKGLPSPNYYGTGDQYINISVYIPETLNKEEREAIEKLRDSENIKPTEEKKKSIFQRMRDFFQ